MQRILQNEDGAAIIELALIAPVFALMTIGIVDISNAYSRKLALEQGAQRAIEKIMQTTQDLPVNDALKAEAVCQVNGQATDETCKTGLITADDVVVTDTLECLSAAGAVVATKTGADALDDCDAGQTQTRYKSVQVTNVYKPMFPVHFLGHNSADGGYKVIAVAGMRTE
jgi:Flp pilus assembly protein TadG